MSVSKRLQPVARIVHQRAEEAARLYAAGQREVRAMQQQFDELMAYRDEYARRLECSGERGLSALQARDYGMFLARLNEAIEQQGKALAGARVDLEARRRTWQEKRSRAGAIDKALDRQREHEKGTRRRREQREQDEHAQQALRRAGG